MRLTVLGGGGAYPTPERPCSGYLVEHQGFRLLVDPGHASMSRLVAHAAPEAIDAVLVTHAHGDHCADLNPLLRARHLADDPPSPLPLFALPGALDALLTLDAAMLADDWELHELHAGRESTVGPLSVHPVELEHFVPNIGVRLEVDGRVLAYTGDSGASPHAGELARGADVLLAEASFVDDVPAASAPGLSSARQRGAVADEAGVGRLVLCHVWPGEDAELLRAAAGREFAGEIAVAHPGLSLDV